MREIGSEFWDVPIKQEQNNIFPKYTQWFLSGRSALQAIIKELKDCHTVSMPCWCCDSMVRPFADAGYDINFYGVCFDNGVVQELNFDADVLFLMNYFGYIDEQVDLKEYKGIVIRDVTHSIFSFTYTDANYYFGSLRKWCGLWTGGYAWSQDDHQLVVEENHSDRYTHLREVAMLQKAEYIKGLRSDKDYLKIFDEAEETLENVGIAVACDRDIKLAMNLDYEFIKNRRRANAEILRSAFKRMLIFKEMGVTDTPMAVPILVPNGKRDELRRYLINNEIYCPVHWPVSEYHKLDERAEEIYMNELSLVCDQRYTEEDMYRMVHVIRQFYKEM